MASCHSRPCDAWGPCTLRRLKYASGKHCFLVIDSVQTDANMEKTRSDSNTRTTLTSLPPPQVHVQYAKCSLLQASHPLPSLPPYLPTSLPPSWPLSPIPIRTANPVDLQEWSLDWVPPSGLARLATKKPGGDHTTLVSLAVLCRRLPPPLAFFSVGDSACIPGHR